MLVSGAVNSDSSLTVVRAVHESNQKCFSNYRVQHFIVREFPGLSDTKQSDVSQRMSHQ